MCQSFSIAGTGCGDGGDLLRTAIPERIGAAGQGGARCADVIHEQDGERNRLQRLKSALQIGTATGDGKRDLAFRAGIPAGKELTAGEGEPAGDRFRQEAAMIDAPVATAGLRHGDPGDDGVRREGKRFRKRQDQRSQRLGRPGLGTVFQLMHEGAVNAGMRAETPGYDAGSELDPIPGKDKALGQKILTAGRAEGLPAGEPAAGAAQRTFRPERIPEPGSGCTLRRPEFSEEPGIKGAHEISSRVSTSRRARVV